jgi:hypothetical protein
MNKVKTSSSWILGGIVLVVASLYAWHYAFDKLGAGVCANQVLETVKSPDGAKNAVVFVRDCGATTDWSTQASVIGIGETISDSDTGNALVIGSDHGKAWPLAIKGWPIIKPQWESPNSLLLHYSKDAAVFLQTKKVSNIEVKFVPISKEFVEKEDLEIRP